MLLTLCLLFLTILVTIGAEPKPSSTSSRCDKRLDVISYSKWPILQGFSQELADNADLVNIGYDKFDGIIYTRAVLHDRRNRTYIHGLHPHFNISNRPGKTRQLVEISGLSVLDIKFGRGFIVILSQDGSVWTAGRNYYGQLSGDTAPRATFTKVLGLPAVKEIAAGYWHSVVLTEDGGLFSWGRGYSRRREALGYITQTRRNPIPKKIILEQGAALPTSVCCSYVACMALTVDALSVPHPLKPGVKLRMKIQLEQHRYAMLQLHLSDQQFYYLPSFRCQRMSNNSLRKGIHDRFPILAALYQRQVFTWGNRKYIGRTGEYHTPGLVSGIPSGETVVKVTCGNRFMVALTASGRLYGWGWNRYGEQLQAASNSRRATELGLRGVRDVVTGRHLTIVRTDADRVYYFGHYNGSNHNSPQLMSSGYPRDLMAKTWKGEESMGAVSLGCD